MGQMFYVEHHLIITIMECICGNPIEQPRADLGLSSCLSCAQVAQKYWQKPKGVMCFGHKTGGELQIVSQAQFAEHRRLNPYGKYTGRGSGVHRVSRATEYI